MRDIVQRTKFRRDLKRQKKRRKDLEKLIAVVRLIASSARLPPQLKPHALQGEWSGLWECHIEPDWLLIYSVTDTEVILARTGTHADLFDA